MVAPAFNPNTLKLIADTVLSGQIEKYFSQLSNQVQTNPGKPMLLDHTFDGIALDTVAEAAFKQVEMSGTSVAKEFRNIGKYVVAGFSAVVLSVFPFLLGYLPTKSEREIAESVRKLRSTGASIATSVRQSLENGTTSGAVGTSLIEHLVVQDDLESSALLDHIVTFLFAGHETTSKGLLWTAYLLATHPDIQEQLLEELVGVANLSSVPSLDSVKDLPLLNQVIKESLRLYPPIGVVVRVPLEDDVLPYSKAFVAKGTPVVIQTYLIGRSPLVYGDDAKEFIPDRWAKDKGLEEKIGRCGWMPFLAGKRNCIGKDFAWNELLLVIAVLVRRFKISLPPGTPPVLRMMKISIRPKEDLPFCVEPRVA